MDNFELEQMLASAAKFCEFCECQSDCWFLRNMKASQQEAEIVVVCTSVFACTFFCEIR